MNELALRVRDDQRGMATAEYAVGLCAATGIAGLLLKLLTSDTVSNLLLSIIQKAFSGLFG